MTSAKTDTVMIPYGAQILLLKRDSMKIHRHVEKGACAIVHVLFVTQNMRDIMRRTPTGCAVQNKGITLALRVVCQNSHRLPFQTDPFNCLHFASA